MAGEAKGRGMAETKSDRGNDGGSGKMLGQR